MLDGVRPSPRNISKCINIKIAESYINDVQFGSKTIQQQKQPNSFVQGIILYQLQLIRLNQDRVFNTRSRRIYAMLSMCETAKLTILEWVTRPMKLLGYLPLAFALHPKRYKTILNQRQGTLTGRERLVRLTSSLRQVDLYKKKNIASV